MSLKGKYALITGSSRGIGRAIALKLAECGAKIGVHYYKNIDAANDTLAKVRERRSDGFIVQAEDRKSTRLNSSHRTISYAVFCLKKKRALRSQEAGSCAPGYPITEDSR